MAPLMYLSFKKVLLVSLVIFLFSCLIVSAAAAPDHSSDSHPQIQTRAKFLSTRNMLFELHTDDEDHPKPKIKTTVSKSSKNQTKLINPTPSLSSSKNQTKSIKSSLSSKNQTKLSSSKNQTKLVKPATTNSTKASASSSTLSLNNKIQLKKLNSTSKSSNSTIPTSISTKKISDLTKPSTPKNQATKPTTTTTTTTKNQSQKPVNSKTHKTVKKPVEPSWIDQEDDTDFVSDFSDLPGKFQKTLIPDLERISSTSKIYINEASKHMTKQFKPIVGNKYAATIASVVSFAFLLIPLLLVSLLFNRIKAYFSLQKLLIFIQVYLSIYFSILCLSSLVTGLEPLKFFYATSQSTYICLQLLQTLGYVLYVLLLLMYLILVFSTDSGLGSKMLGLAQTFVGCAVGLHYYMSVFHRAVLRQPPKTNWKVHGIYAACFLVICLFATAERRKKAYLEEGGEEGKKS